MTPLLYAKLAGFAVLAAALFFSGYHFGGMASTTKLEGFRAAQAENTAKAVLAERAASAIELARVNAILKGYQDAPIDPIVSGVAHRVFLYANAAGCPVLEPGAHPAAALGAGAVPRGDPTLERLSQDAFDAAEHDARELTALQAAWPR